MTKLKSKKLTKSTFAIIIMAIVMVAMIAFGGTYAYFTANSTQDKAQVKTGFLKLRDSNAIQTITKTGVFPSEVLVDANSITIDLETNDDAGNYVAIKIKFDFYDYNGQKITMPAGWDTDSDGFCTPEELTAAETNKKPKIETYTYTVVGHKDNSKNGQQDIQSYVPVSTDFEGETGATNYTTTYNAYKEQLDDYQADVKAYNIESAKARLISSLNSDRCVVNTTALSVEGTDVATSTKTTATEYFWNRLAGTQDIYICTKANNSQELQAIGLPKDGADHGNSSVKSTLIVNNKAFDIPAEIQDNWDESRDENGTPSNASDDKFAQHSEAGLMNGTIVISFQAVSVQATGLEDATAIQQLKDLLNSKWIEPTGPGAGTTPDMGTDW